MLYALYTFDKKINKPKVNKNLKKIYTIII